MNSFIVETPFGFNLDLTFWANLLTLPTGQAVSAIFAIIGWTAVALAFFFMGAKLWVYYRRSNYAHKWQWTLLAVDVPPLLVQSPKAVEQVFAHLSGAHISNNIGQKFWQGRWQKWFSLEIVSIEGYIQFLVRVEAEFRDLVEAAIYAQYPEAEITEVEEYANTPTRYPDKEYDVFGVEFTLAEQDAYPIRTYSHFEYNISKDVVFSDPMAAILENFSRIGHGEHFWLQIIIEPTDNHWKEKGIALVKRIIAGKKIYRFWLVDWLMNIPYYIAKETENIWAWTFEPIPPPVGEEPLPGKVMDLPPGLKDTVQAIEEKIAKIGYKTKIRALYVARKEAYNPSRCIDGFIGSLNQFHVIGRNALAPYSVTLAHYFFKNWLTDWEKTRFTSAFKKRRPKVGGNPYILNIEELATLWHFPLPFVKTPLVQKSGAKRGEPPIGLPVEAMESPLKRIAPKGQPVVAEEPVEAELEPPEELPYG